MRRIAILSCIIVLAMLVFCATAGCNNETPATTAAMTTPADSSEPAAAESSGETTAKGPSIDDLTDLPDVFYTPDFGDVVPGPEFYWSPAADCCLFIGYVKNDQQQFVPAAYLYDMIRDRLVKLVDGRPDANYYLAEPAWSPDESKVIVPFYDFTADELPLLLYDLAGDELKILPVSGTLPAFSPDGRQIAFTNADGAVDFYGFSAGEVLQRDYTINGYSPIWFAKMDKLLYIAPTGNNPSNLEYGWLSEVRLLDFQAPDIETAVMAESSYQRIRWLSQDQLVLVESGMDDGFYTAILNAGDGSITDLGEARLILQKTWDRQISPVVIDFANSAIRRYDQQMKEINAYMTSADNIVAVISLLPDNRLLGLGRAAAENKCYAIILSPDGSGSRKIAYYSGNLIIKVAADGSRAACFDQENSRFYILDAKKLYGRIG